MWAIERNPLKDTKGDFKFAFVGFADILGFSKKIKDKTKRDIIVTAYKEIRQELLIKDNWFFPTMSSKIVGFGENVGEPLYHLVVLSNEHIYRISDSIFFVLVPERTSLLYLHQYGKAAIQIMSRILSICWKYNLPARGAISDGEIYYDSEEDIFWGEPIVKAVKWESIQKFVWFSVEPTSWLVKDAEKSPKGIVRKIAHQIPISNDLFKEDGLKEFQNEWPLNVENIYTTLPDYTFYPQIAKESKIEESFKYLSPSQILDYIKKSIRQETGKEEGYWLNTQKLFNLLGNTPERIDSLIKSNIDSF